MFSHTLPPSSSSFNLASIPNPFVFLVVFVPIHFLPHSLFVQRSVRSKILFSKIKHFVFRAFPALFSRRRRFAPQVLSVKPVG